MSRNTVERVETIGEGRGWCLNEKVGVQQMVEAGRKAQGRGRQGRRGIFKVYTASTARESMAWDGGRAHRNLRWHKRGALR